MKNNEMSLGKLSKIQRRRLTIFLICILFATGAWFFSALSNRYTYRIKAVARCIAPSQKQVFVTFKTDTLDLQVEGTGWQVLRSKIRVELARVNVKVKNWDKQNYIIIADQLENISKELGADQKIFRIRPDTLFFDFSKRFVKRVPVTLLQNLTFDQQYDVSGKIQIKPDCVTLTGSPKNLEAINSWPTETLKLEVVNQLIVAKLLLKQPAKEIFTVRPASVRVLIPIDEFTEKIIEVPIKVLNASSSEQIELLPQKVKITLLTALDNYAQLDPTLFEASVDLDQWRKKSYSQLPVNLTHFPNYCKLIALEPLIVDFIIRK